MRARRLTLVAIAAAFAGSLVLSGAQPQARADDTTQTSLQSGTLARPLNRKMPSFPDPEANAGVEGWVIVSYVIGPDGTVGETLIEDSSGRKAFERASVKAVEHWAYEPATMNGEPVEQCHAKVLMLFELEQGRRDKRGVKRAFKNQYKRASQLLEKGELKKARGKIDEIERKFVTNLNESSRLWILRSMLQEKEGDDLGQLKSLISAVPSDGKYVESNTYLAVMSKILNLERKLKRFADALTTIESLTKLDLDEELNQQLDQIELEIEAIRTSGYVLAIEAEIGEVREEHDNAGMWRHTLLRRVAGIEEISGSLDRVELRCDWRRIKAKPEKGRAWRIPPEWGDCTIYVFGEPGSTFQLLEYSSTAS